MGQVDNTTFWLERTFDETMTLLEEAKHYHAYRFPRQVDHMVPTERLELTRESLRVTSRLSHMMSWLIHEKAILNDEITRTDYIEANIPLAEEDICTACEDVHVACPQNLKSLMDRSWALFMRASRIEEMLRK